MGIDAHGSYFQNQRRLNHIQHSRIWILETIRCLQYWEFPDATEGTSHSIAHFDKLGLAKGAQKNSDSLELLRGKSGRVMGQMMGLMVTTKVLPSTLIPPTPLKTSPGSPKHLQQRPPRIRRTPP